MQRGRGGATSTIVHHPSQRRGAEVQRVDMDEIWAEQQVENPQWVAMYSAIVSAALQAALAAPGDDTSTVDLDYAQLAAEADQAYAQYAARLRGLHNRR